MWYRKPGYVGLTKDLAGKRDVYYSSDLQFRRQQKQPVWTRVVFFGCFEVGYDDNETVDVIDSREKRFVLRIRELKFLGREEGNLIGEVCATDMAVEC